MPVIAALRSINAIWSQKKHCGGSMFCMPRIQESTPDISRSQSTGLGNTSVRDHED